MVCGFEIELRATFPGGCGVGQFGDKFRKAREKKGISLDDVSNVTKISSRMLQAIEEERFDQLPGGVFNKGFIRAYARHVGLNDEEAVNEYLGCLRQAQIDAQAVWEPNAASGKEKRPRVEAHQIAANQAVAGQVSRTSTKKSETGQGQSGSEAEELPDLQLPRVEHVRRARPVYSQGGKSLPWRPVVIALLLLITMSVIWQRHMRHAGAEGQGMTAVAARESAPQLVQASGSGSPAMQASPSGNEVSRTEPAKANGHAGDHINEAAAKPARKPNDDEDGAAGSDAANDLPERKSPARFTLVIHADENSWISVTADGQPVSHETLIAPADASVRANREIVARIGNAAGVSFIWNGQEIPAQGAESEVKTFVFDADGMHPVAAPQTPTQSQ